MHPRYAYAPHKFTASKRTKKYHDQTQDSRRIGKDIFSAEKEGNYSMSQPTPNTPAPAPGKRKKGSEKKTVEYKVLTKKITDECDATLKALEPLCWSKKDEDGKDVSPPTDIFGAMLSGDGEVAIYKSQYGTDITKYLGSKPRKTAAGMVRDKVAAARVAMINAYKAAKAAKDAVAEAQTALDTQRKLYKANSKDKMQAQLAKRKQQEANAAALRAKLEKELAED
jgi:hypothetical protein